jgi:hypothetical protein
MSQSLVAPLVVLPAVRRPKSDIVIGDLVTVDLVSSTASGGFVQAGACVERIAYGTFFVRLVGWPPAPYQVGDKYPLSGERVTDW